MRAMVYNRYGPPDVLHLKEIERPVPKDNELLVKIEASSVNAVDWHFMRGSPVLVRLQYGMFRPKNTVLGYDFAGRIEQVGGNVTQFKPGDEVFGGLGFGLGGFSEYACIPENAFVSTKPPTVGFEQAAAVPGAAVAALIGLRHRGRVQPGQRVLINGSAGGTGTFAVQIAKACGAEVTAVCSTRNVEMVRRLGADHVVDYRQEDFTRTGETYDLLLDNVGNRRVPDMVRALRDGGTVVIVGFTNMRLMLQQSILGPRAAKARNITWSKPASAEPSRDHADALKELLESGTIIPEIEKVYPLEELPEAMRLIETGHARAKIVITL